MSALPPIAEITEHDRDVRFVPKADIRAVLFNDLVRLGGEVGRHFDAERLGGFEVDDELKFGGLDYRQVPWFLALENPPGIDAGDSPR